jgi:NAD dependent epimerase/dehydratase family
MPTVRALVTGAAGFIGSHLVDALLTSTAATYGEPEIVPTSEDLPSAPLSPYGTSKAATERYLAQKFASAWHVDRGAADVEHVRAAAGPSQRVRVLAIFTGAAVADHRVTVFRRRSPDARLCVHRRRSGCLARSCGLGRDDRVRRRGSAADRRPGRRRDPAARRPGVPGDLPASRGRARVDSTRRPATDSRAVGGDRRDRRARQRRRLRLPRALRGALQRASGIGASALTNSTSM